MARRRKPPQPPVIADVPEEDLERYAGQWVAVKDGKVIFGSQDGGAVWDWLDEHGVEDATIVRLRGKNEQKVWMFRSARLATR